jgi:hypothetical protein
MASTDITVAITLGGNADFAITRANDLVVTQEYSPGLKIRANLGRCTKQRIEQLKSYLDRLSVHAVE